MAEDPTDPTAHDGSEGPDATDPVDTPKADEPGATSGEGDTAKGAAPAGGSVELGKPGAAEGSPTEPEAKAKARAKGEGDQAEATGPVVRRKVVSKRVTPKGGPVAGGAKAGGRPAKGATKGSTAAHAHAAEGDDADWSSRYTPPTAKYAQGPSPWWVPALMFGLLGLGALIIILNYARVFGDPDNMRLLLGLGFILGGIITATQYR